MKLLKLLFVVALGCAALQISGKVDLVAQAADRLPFALPSSSSQEVEGLLASRRDAPSLDWIGRQEFSLEPQGFAGMFAAAAGEWDAHFVQILGPDGTGEPELWLGVKDTTVTRNLAGEQNYYGALTGRRWSIDPDGDVTRLGSASGSEEGDAINNIERLRKNGSAVDWIEGCAPGEAQYLDGGRAEGYCAELLGWGISEVRSASLEMTLKARDDDDVSAVYSGDCQLLAENIGWFNVRFKGTVKSSDRGTRRYKQTYSIKGLCASAKELGCQVELEVSGSLTCQEASPEDDSRTSRLEGSWERLGDVFAGMVVKFQKVGGTYYGFLREVPTSVRSNGDWREGQIKMVATGDGPSGATRLQSLSGKNAETNSMFAAGTTSFRDDGVMIYTANSARGLTGDRQRWQPVARP